VYKVQYVNPKEYHLDSVAKELIRILEKDNQHEEGRRILFVPSIAECDNLAESFGCFKHHGDMHKDDREKQLEGWKTGRITDMEDVTRRETWIVATPGLITGYDYHRIEDVIFYGIGYGLLNLVQGGGRGGRSGQRANVILLHNDRITNSHPGLWKEDDMELLGLMLQWAQNRTECRRIIISNTMDGIQTVCRDLAGVQACDVCDPQSKTVKMVERAMERAEKVNAAIIPMEDIQELVSTPSFETIRSGESRYEESMEDMKFDEDDLILSLDLSTIETGSFTETVTSGEPVRKKSIDVDKTRGKGERRVNLGKGNDTLSEATIAGVRDVGMNVRVAGSSNMSMVEKKQQKSKIVDEFGTTLRGHCVICWAWKGIYVRIDGGVEHKVFTDCGRKENCNGRLVWGGGPNFFATKIDFKRFHFCLYCGFPQDVNHTAYLPSCHPVPGRSGGPCEFKRMVTHILFTIHQQGELWKKVKERFGLGVEMDNIDQYAKWCESYVENTGNYWMGLEVVIWCWKERSHGRFKI